MLKDTADTAAAASLIGQLIMRPLVKIISWKLLLHVSDFFFILRQQTLSSTDH